MPTAPDTAPASPAATAAARGLTWHRVRTSMTRREWAGAGGMAAFILALHVIGWFTLVAIVAPRHCGVGTQAFGTGMGVTAYTLGMRHAFDADHIAAIDNTTRKMMGEGRRPLSVGFWFSLGHSTIVFTLALLLSLGVRALAGPVRDDDSELHDITGWIGTTSRFWGWVSGLDLNIVGCVVVGLFVVTWAVAAVVWRLGRIEEKWEAGMTGTAPAERAAEHSAR
ncbi:hypothetical protein [Streptomyces sp. NPDC058451]|uniref:HoxN/HupN/NixA family nickel/cobalt transporter n=1 Tax=unclassified Streptomyces TaxID=2593676 RepID=UPI00364BA9A7